MEFWGVEVKPGQIVKCEAGDEIILHLSQSSLGETKKEKGYENVPIFVKINDQKLVIGTLSADKCAQIQHDLIFEKEFELSHGSKNTSVFFVGYKGVNEIDEPENGFDDSSSDDELEFDEKENGKTSKSEQRKSFAEKANMTAKLKANAEKPKKEQLKVDKKANYKDLEDDSDEDDSDEDEDIIESSGDSSEEDDEEDSSEEEATPEKVETDKKRKSNSASKTPIPEKKAKIVTPAVNPKTGGDGKKAHVHVATPHPAKRGGKPQQSFKPGGSVTCKSCDRTFNSENALQAHSKSKHGDASK